MNQVISKDGTVIAFDCSDKGSAIILVGGAFQHRAVDPRTAQVAALLASHFTVFHYDRRGRGDSSDTQPYAVEREIEDLDALIQDAGAVFGMSSEARPLPSRRLLAVLPSRSWRATSHRSTLVTSRPAKRQRATRDIAHRGTSG